MVIEHIMLLVPQSSKMDKNITHIFQSSFQIQWRIQQYRYVYTKFAS